MNKIIDVLSEEFIEKFNSSKRIKIICPFIKEDIAKKIINQRANFKLITRFNLRDFYSGVSDIASLKYLFSLGCDIRGIKDIHAKLYLFDKEVIITSANLTSKGIYSNHEISLITSEKYIYDECNKYFDYLWNSTKQKVSLNKLDKWDKEIKVYKQKRPYEKLTDRDLPDLGAKVSHKILGNPKLDNSFTYYYFNFESNEHRRWEDATRIGFISAGYGEYYSKPLYKLKKGDKVIVYLLKGDNVKKNHLGYAGICEVLESAIPINKFKIDSKYKLTATDFYHHKHDLKLCEHIVTVKWEKKLKQNQAIKFRGIFSYRGILCKMYDNRKKARYTLKELKIKKLLD